MCHIKLMGLHGFVKQDTFPMGKRKPTTNCIKKRFLEYVSQGWTIDKAAKLLKTSRQNFYRWANGDPVFAAAWEEADPPLDSIMCHLWHV